MTGISMHQNVFRIAKPDSGSNSSQNKAKKRNRPAISCSACRTRKMKCDRQRPCISCSKRGEEDQCIYPEHSHTGRDRPDGSSKTSEVQLRLQKLEAMVTSLMQTPSDGRSDTSTLQTGPSMPEISPMDQNPPQISPSSGHLDSRGSEISYLGATHWTTILDNIRGIKDFLEPSMEKLDETAYPSPPDGPDIIVDTSQPLTLSDCLRSLPPRTVTDKLLSVYFNANQLQFLPLTHTGQFLRRYEMFWANPSAMSFLWISILFSVLYLGAQFNQSSKREVTSHSNEAARKVFLTRSAQALVAGKYLKARPYSVEAVISHALCKFTLAVDPDSDVWLLMGVAARLAMRMGYHRDPRHLSNISAFEGEMRRRTFFFVETFDLLLSFQSGLPTILHEEEYDTELPSNLLDSDFDEDSEVLPPSRPPTDPTPMLYYCIKGRMLKVFRRVFRLAMSFETHSYDDILRLDKTLRESHDEIPPSLRMRPLSSSITDPPGLILNRRNLETMYLKILCILHRHYLNHDRTNPAYEYSRRTCTDAALRLLEHQVELQIACQPGGQLHEDSWMLCNVTQQDFLLAGMIICLDLHESSKKLSTATAEDKLDHANKYDALKRSHEIWLSQREESRDAQRATKIIAAMLLKVQRPNMGLPDAAAAAAVPPQEAMQVVTPESLNGLMPSMSNNAVGSFTSDGILQPWDIGAIDGGLPDALPMDGFGASLDGGSVNPLDTIFGSAPELFNWGLIDQGLLSHVPNNDDDNNDFQPEWQQQGFGGGIGGQQNG